MLFLSKWFGVTTSDAERYLDVEQKYAEEIVDHVLLMQTNAAAKQNRPLCRGTHAKGICARARFEVLDVTVGREPALGARLARGIFATPGRYPATVRFANSDPQVNSDYKADVRSLSFFVDLTQGGANVLTDGVRRQDFVSAQPAWSTDPPRRMARMAWCALMPRRAAVPTTDLMVANRSAPQLERKPPVTLR